MTILFLPEDDNLLLTNQIKLITILPEEILEEILIKLPAKSLVRIRLVCKRWFSLISDPKFVKKHLNYVQSTNIHHHKLVLRSNTRLTFQFCDVNGKKANQTTNFPLRAPLGLRVIGSINGLLCVGLDSGVEFHSCKLVLWNPLLKIFNKLPATNSDSLPLHRVGIGFGYDSSVDDYKVVKVMREEFVAMMYRIEIYALKTNAWRTLLLPDLPECVNLFDHIYEGTYVNGSIYWIVYKYDVGCNVKSIMCFDLIEEKLKFIDLLPTNHLTKHLMDVVGVLGVLETSSIFGKAFLWTAKEDNGKIYCSKKTQIQFPIPSKPISFMKSGELLLNCETRDSYGQDDKVAVYNLKKKTFSPLFSYDRKLWTLEASYIETLVSPYAT